MCGIVGISNHQEAGRLAYLSLYALQHRGEEGAGIVTYDGRKVYLHKNVGLVGEVFEKRKINTLKGYLAIGHNRYSTTGASTLENVQPFLLNYKDSFLAIAHNGNFINTLSLRRKLRKQGVRFKSTLDSEVIAQLLLTSSKKRIEDALVDALLQVKGSYSLVLLFKEKLIGARDPYGFKPLCLGRLKDSYILVSETCALDLIQARYVREIEPGEIVFIDKNRIRSFKPFPPPSSHSLCIFEYIYFARPDSNIFGANVYLTRKRLGEELAREHPVKADFVMPIPDSGNYAALGFAQEANIPYEIAMVRNHYIGRTFIQPSQFIRNFKVKVKLNPIRDVLKGKRIAIIEDSIVRGTTSRIRVKTLREAGAREVHMRVSCPPLRFPCFYGIDFPTKKELIASEHSIEEIRKFIGVDSLKYLSLEGMLNSMLLPKERFCTACFNGRYPTEVKKQKGKQRVLNS